MSKQRFFLEMFDCLFTKGIKYYIALLVVNSLVIIIFSLKIYFSSFLDFVDDSFNPRYALVKNVINKVSKTLEKVKFPPKNHYYKTTYNL